MGVAGHRPRSVKMSKKKQQRNGFFYYMLDMQQEFRGRGRDVPMRDMPIFAGPSWSKLSDAQKHRYNLRAKGEKAMASGASPEARAPIPSPPVDSTKCGRRDTAGNLISERVDVESELREKRRRMVESIRGMLGSGRQVTLESFWLIDVQSLCHIPNKPNHKYLPCEVGVVRYSLNQGVLSKFHSFIKPGTIPIGYRYLAQSTSEATNQIPVEGAPGAVGDYRKLLGDLENYLTCDGTSHSVPPVFTKRESVDRVEWSLQWLADNAGVTNRITRVYDLESLLTELVSHSNSGHTPSGVSLLMVGDMLSTSNYAHDACTRCDYHQDLDCSHCSLGVSHTYCYVMSELLCPIYNISITRNHFSVLIPTTAPPKRTAKPAPQYSRPPGLSRPAISAPGSELEGARRMGRGIGRGITSLNLRQPQSQQSPPALGHGHGSNLYMS